MVYVEQHQQVEPFEEEQRDAYGETGVSQLLQTQLQNKGETHQSDHCAVGHVPDEDLQVLELCLEDHVLGTQEEGRETVLNEPCCEFSHLVSAADELPVVHQDLLQEYGGDHCDQKEQDTPHSETLSEQKLALVRFAPS